MTPVSSAKFFLLIDCYFLDNGNLYPSSGMEDAGREEMSFPENRLEEQEQEDSDLSWDDDDEDSGYTNNALHLTTQEVIITGCVWHLRIN